MPTSFAYQLALLAFRFVCRVFFRQIVISSNAPQHLLDKEGSSVIFAIAPHSNQFVDALVLMTRCKRHIHFLCAEKSTKRKIVGFFTRMISAIPVTRAMDLQQKGIGLLVSCRGNVLQGEGTCFKRQVSNSDFIYLGHKGTGGAFDESSCIGCVEEVESDEILRLSKECTRALLPNSPFFIVPRITHRALYARVWEGLAQGQAIGIFPEGTSHDQSHFLPLKPGIAQMALGAIEAYPQLQDKVQIIPVGLCYLHPHKFQSRAAVLFGHPISPSPELIQAYAQEKTKRWAVEQLMGEVHQALCGLSLRAPNESSMAVIKTVLFLYQPQGQRINDIMERLRIAQALSSRLAQAQCLPWWRRIEAFNERLNSLHIECFQLDHHHIPRPSLWQFASLMGRLLAFSPGLILNAPALGLTRAISYAKAKEAKRSSIYKLTGLDVVASWKIIIAAVVFPMQYLIYCLVIWRLWGGGEGGARTLIGVIGGFLVASGVAFWLFTWNASSIAKTMAQIVGSFCYDEALLGEYAELRRETEKVFRLLGITTGAEIGEGNVEKFSQQKEREGGLNYASDLSLAFCEGDEFWDGF